MKKLAIIGASEFQAPLIIKAKELGIETHVFAWKCGDVGESIADYFYPISITECEEIYQQCKKIGIDGICTIGTDLGTIPVSYVANRLGLVANSEECVKKATNKHLMRKCFEKNGDPSPRSVEISGSQDVEDCEFDYPVICKPTDRSGSRGIYKVNNKKELLDAVDKSIEYSFEKKALVEEFAEGQEYSVEYISYQGMHHFLALTKKYTTGAPNFIETGHIEPAPVSEELLEKVKSVTEHALDSLEVTNGASHTELKINHNGNIKIIEIGARMGGDFIGSHLVQMSTGVDFVKCVIQVAMGEEPKVIRNDKTNHAAVRFVFGENEKKVFATIKKENPSIIVGEHFDKITDEKVVDSSSRFGYFMLKAEVADEILEYMPRNEED
ncbi:ATP-grasp domain-containing protein [Pseudobutyrivibrio ruminis]|uniref:Carbamoyl-phosphate synthase large subunit n=1 Tax=Pseudobutyrivibrio ruminis TaxID=46206 RepID=A0A2G3DU68_9FIRM|nr:ATP-grasp domain-containing protein [Pseudobutyrivibrio ruminis]PHU34544.1 carbamoyl-phosphate synthase large subunit [Pseudobutyrivibrio ruminis]